MDPSVLGSVRLGSSRRLTGLGLSPEQVALDQRRRILTGAAQAFARHGYARATVRMMIESAGVSRRTFYELFDGKAHAYLDAHDDALALLTARVCAADGGDEWAERVARAISAALSYATFSPERTSLLLADGFVAGPWVAHVEDALLARFAPALRLGRAFASARPASLETAILGGIVGVVARRLAAGRSSDLPAEALGLAEFALIPYVGPEAARIAVRRVLPQTVGRTGPPSLHSA